MPINPYQQLYVFLDALKTIQKRGGGGLAIVPRNILNWRVETTKGGEVDYLAWPQIDYGAEKALWAGLGVNSQKNRPWPLGDGYNTASMLDRLSPLNYPNEQIPTQQIYVILAQTATVDEAIINIDKGLKAMDPNYPTSRSVNSWLIAGGIGALLATYLLIH